MAVNFVLNYPSKQFSEIVSLENFFDVNMYSDAAFKCDSVGNLLNGFGVLFGDYILVEKWADCPDEFWYFIHKTGRRFQEYSSTAFEHITSSLAIISLFLFKLIPCGSAILSSSLMSLSLRLST